LAVLFAAVKERMIAVLFSRVAGAWLKYIPRHGEKTSRSGSGAAREIDRKGGFVSVGYDHQGISDRRRREFST
jgi:hypothetical protein